MNYIVSIGLEVHVQLQTESKMFCSCETGYGAPPNTHVCPVCLGYPGAMPVMNKEAIRMTVLAGMMIDSEISTYSKFDRKSYFYPDMPKNYQITQYDKPFCVGGEVEIMVDEQPKIIGVTRIHLEEDVGKNMHFRGSSGVDFNRAGIPLMEIVSEPDMSSPQEAYDYLTALRQIVTYTGISECNQEEGNMRCDVNCSIRPEGQEELGTKTELKNLNSFKAAFHALEYEIARQKDVLGAGGEIVQETRRWDPDTGETYSMRVKEKDHDYRYFPEPDLMPVILDSDLVAKWRSGLPELPDIRKKRIVTEYGLPEYDAGVLVSEKALVDYFEGAAKLSANPKAISNWVMTEVLRYLAEKEMAITALKVTPEALSALVALVDDKTINMTTAKGIFATMCDKGGAPADIVKAQGLAQVSDDGAIAAFVKQAMDENPKSVADYKSGNKAAVQFLVGQVMRMSKGKANPQMVVGLLTDLMKD